MHIFILEDIGELESAKILLGGLLASGEIKDERELHFLTERLEDLQKRRKIVTCDEKMTIQPCDTSATVCFQISNHII